MNVITTVCPGVPIEQYVTELFVWNTSTGGLTSRCVAMRDYARLCYSYEQQLPCLCWTKHRKLLNPVMTQFHRLVNTCNYLQSRFNSCPWGILWRLFPVTDCLPVTVTARSKAWTVFARSDAGIVGLNPSQGIDVCVCVYSVFVLSCA
jgi:hypothetical protein